MEFDFKVQNLAMIYILLNWAVTSTTEVDMGYLWYPKELLEKFSTDVSQQRGIYLRHCSCKS
jgi:hypothetical protein